MPQGILAFHQAAPDNPTPPPLLMPKPPDLDPETVAAQLCLDCGLCCDGTLFKDLELQQGDDPAVFRALGCAPPSRGTMAKIPQPCAALSGCACRIYADRPSRCRQFECLLFQSVRQGKTSAQRARDIIRTARARARRVRQLLLELGESNERSALSIRFRRMRAKFERGWTDAAAIDRFGELTVAVHELNFLMSEAFYGPSSRTAKL